MASLDILQHYVGWDKLRQEILAENKEFFFEKGFNNFLEIIWMSDFDMENYGIFLYATSLNQEFALVYFGRKMWRWHHLQHAPGMFDLSKWPSWNAFLYDIIAMTCTLKAVLLPVLSGFYLIIAHIIWIIWYDQKANELDMSKWAHHGI